MSFDFGTLKTRAEAGEHSPTTALLAIAYFHRPDPDGGMGYTDGGYGRIDPACLTCGRSDEYAVPWPCATFRAAMLGLGELVPHYEATE